MSVTTTITELKKFILTQAQYDALLVADEIEPNAEYYVTDAGTDTVSPIAGYPYLLEFGNNRENTENVILNIKGADNGLSEGTKMYLMRNLPKKKHVTTLEDGERVYHWTSGWRHPRQGGYSNPITESEWAVEASTTSWVKSTSECFAQFVRFQQYKNEENFAYARINGWKLARCMDRSYPYYMDFFFSPRQIATFGFALFKDGVRVSNICPVKITVYGEMGIYNGEADKLSIHVYPA